MAASLLRERSFASLFGCQFLGALNDNFFKNAFLIAISYGHMQIHGFDEASLVALASGLFILPFFVFSPLAGQLADKYSKGRLIRWVKLTEVALMVLAALAFWFNQPWMVMLLLFWMGTQSSFFGPAKYSILPELVSPQDLTGANALVETGTFVAILLGTIAGGLVIALGGEHRWILACSLVLLAILGWLASLGIERVPGKEPDLKIELNPWNSFMQSYNACRQTRSVKLSILAISWFWFFGAALLTIFPTYAKGTLYGDEHVVTLLLALFCVGTSIGALLSERMGGNRLELGLVPLGAIGLSLCVLDLIFSSPSLPDSTPLRGIQSFVLDLSNLRLLLDVLLLAVFGGFYTVPLYTLIQERSDPELRSRVIAGNNILNAVWMVLSSLLLMGLSAMDLGPLYLFGILALLNTLIAIYIFSVVPEFFLRFLAWCLATFVYRLRAHDTRNIPDEGPALLIANHVSFVDWLFVASVTQRPIRFVMYHTFFKIPVLGWLFRLGKVIPIAPSKEDPELLARAYERIDETLAQGELVCIFPEGGLTNDGKMAPFRPGIRRILEKRAVPVVPMVLEGLWESRFSRNPKRPGLWKRLRTRRIHLRTGQPISADQAKDTELAHFERAVLCLGTEIEAQQVSAGE